MATGRSIRRRAGFTLIELLVTITIIAVAATIMVPYISDDAKLRVMAASAVITSDIEYAQVRTISHPNDPIIVTFDIATGSYWLARPSSPKVPIAREDTGQPYLVTLGVGRGRAASGVTISLTDLPNDTIVFDAQGGMDDFTLQPMIVLTSGTEKITLSIGPTTGTITETQG